MFANKVVLITGGNAGIGGATALSFAKHGASLTLVGRNEAKLKKIVQNCEKQGVMVHGITADVTKDDEARTIIQETINKYGQIDVLVNNAAILRLTNIFKPDILKIYDVVMRTNLRAVVNITNLAVSHLKETKGNIVNVSSASSLTAKLPNSSIYGISEVGLDYFTRWSALELSVYGIRVNSVNPGVVFTEMIQDAQSAGYTIPSSVVELSLLGRVSDPEEVADLILFLASEKAKRITGSSFVMDNGYLLK